LIDPGGRPFFCKAVDGVRSVTQPGDGALPPDSVARLRHWGFNTLGVGADPTMRDEGLVFMAVVDFLTVGTPIASGRVRLPDVFDPEWPKLAAAHALDVCAPLADDPQLLGWVADDRLRWAQPESGRGEPIAPSLLQICLSLEPRFPAYHAAWEFVLALHGGRIDAMARAWGIELGNKEVIRELTRAEEGLATRGYLRDEARWSRECARRYFTTTAAAIRAADPNHLVLGSRADGPVGAAVMSECVYPAVDLALQDWRELPVSGDAETPHPVLANQVAWNTADFLKLPAAARVLRLTSVEWMLRRARIALDRLARHPAVVGYAWGQWQDEPGEQPPFARGLVHVNGSEAREHTELLAQFNLRAEGMRGAT
jgi:agarase